LLIEKCEGRQTEAHNRWIRAKELRPRQGNQAKGVRNHYAARTRLKQSIYRINNLLL
jgi:hypothetical protein